MGSFLFGYPACTSMSRSSVAETTGGISPIMSLVSGEINIVFSTPWLLFLTIRSSGFMCALIPDGASRIYADAVAFRCRHQWGGGAHV